MSLKVSRGNMYPWVTHTHAALGGQCPHECSYCYVTNPRFGRPKKYQGPLRLIESEMGVDFGHGRTIFIENCNDLFAREVPDGFIQRVMAHCIKYPDNIYVFQTKNPIRYREVKNWPPMKILGATIETNRITPGIGHAPTPFVRFLGMVDLETSKFVTIEPILDFDVDILSRWIVNINPSFVNIGADSKGHGLPEPSIKKVDKLINIITSAGIEIREKHNLERLRK